MENLKNFLSLALVAAFVCCVTGVGVGPMGPIKIYSITECDPNVNLINLEAKMQTEPDGSDSVQVSFDLASDFSGDVTVSFYVDQCDDNGDNCEEDVYVLEEKDFFPIVYRFAPKLWSKFLEQLTPKVEEEDRIPAGFYSVDHFQASHEELSAPQVAYGRAEVEVSVAQDDGELFCVVIDKQTFPPLGLS